MSTKFRTLIIFILLPWARPGAVHRTYLGSLVHDVMVITIYSTISSVPSELYLLCAYSVYREVGVREKVVVGSS